MCSHVFFISQDEVASWFTGVDEFSQADIEWNVRNDPFRYITDFAYGPKDARQLRKSHPARAIINADNFAWFVLVSLETSDVVDSPSQKLIRCRRAFGVLYATRTFEPQLTIQTGSFPSQVE